MQPILSHLSEVELEKLAKQLEQSSNYRVLRRLVPRTQFSNEMPQSSRVAAILDLETTGLDIAHDEIIELAILKFRFSENDQIIDVVEQYSCLNEPAGGIPEEVSVLTGISQSDVMGQLLDSKAVSAFLTDVSVIIAHNASFDRPIFERYFPDKANINWACSATEIDWKAEGRSSAKLEFLLNCNGYFYESHRALSDCFALLELLAMPLPRSKATAFATMLDVARQLQYRVYAVGAPYETKDLLKKRGYRWSDGSQQPHKAWWKDVSETELPVEIAYLRQKIVGDNRDFPTLRMTAQNRYRAGSV